jgi:GT2 family glycosyltransferase
MIADDQLPAPVASPGSDAVSVVVVSYESEQYLERSLEWAVERGYEVILVDSASTDGGVALVRHRFPAVQVIELDRNVGYGAANNVGIAATTCRFVLVLNPDAWPVGDAVARLLEAAEQTPRAGIVGPRLVDERGERQLSIRGFPTVWRLATEFLFLRWFAPWSRALNAFYGARVDPRKRAEVDWLMGAAILVRRSALDEVGAFDPAFFLYAEEVDLAYRMRREGWTTVYEPAATFVHVGGASTSRRPAEYYRELIRSHVRFLDKHRGRPVARRARRLMLLSMRLRARILRGERGRIAAQTAAWLEERNVNRLLAASPRYDDADHARRDTPT